MNRSLFVIILVVALDAIGIGLIFPILPSLLEELTGQRRDLDRLRPDPRRLRGDAVHVLADPRPALRPLRPPAGDDRLARRRGHRLSHHGVHPDAGGAGDRPHHRRHHQRQHVGRRRLHRRHLRGEGPGAALQLDERGVRRRLHHRADAGRRAEPLFPARAVPRRRGAQRAEPPAGRCIVSRKAACRAARSSISRRSIRSRR